MKAGNFSLTFLKDLPENYLTSYKILRTVLKQIDRSILAKKKNSQKPINETNICIWLQTLPNFSISLQLHNHVDHDKVRYKSVAWQQILTRKSY